MAYMKHKILFFLLLFALTNGASAQFVQEIELSSGAILEGYIKSQKPGRSIEFHITHVLNDPKEHYTQVETDYNLNWRDVKVIRRGQKSHTEWCVDSVALKDGAVYVGQIIEQTPSISLTMQLDNTDQRITLNANQLKFVEKITKDTSNLWADRPYTNRLILTDNSVHEGVIVLQYWGETITDSYVELLHGSGYRERLFLPDIVEYTTILIP